MQVSIEQSDKSSLDSVEIIEHDCECDIGFGSMSSDQMMRQKSKAEQHGLQKELDELKQEVTKLKCDKLDLLKQNVVSWSIHLLFYLFSHQFPFFSFSSELSTRHKKIART